MSKLTSPNSRRLRPWLLPAAAALLVLSALPSAAPGQWAEENYDLVVGWNAVWLPIDATAHLPAGGGTPPVEIVLGGTAEIEEVWAWNPHASESQFTQDPAAPVQADSQWRVWRRGDAAGSTLASLPGNTAYLVKVAPGSAAFTLTLVGRPVPPRYAWSSSGLNFFGFPMREPASVADRNFDRFLSFSQDIAQSPDIFSYPGGEAGPSPSPARVSAPRNTAVVRGDAYWIRGSSFSDYYGPLRVRSTLSGLDFGDTGSTLSLRIENVTDREVTATLTPAASAAPPAGQPAVAGAVPLRLRGALDAATGRFVYSDLDGPADFTIPAGGAADAVLAVDRVAMGGVAGDVFQSLARVSDSLDISRIDVPVRAVTTSRSGLWVGAAVVTMVEQVTATPATTTGDDGEEAPSVVTDESDPAYGQGSAILRSSTDAAAPSAFPFRLIVHRSDGGAVKLLQQVYVGEGTGGAAVVSPAEIALDPARLFTARRLSSAAFPLDANIAGAGADLGLTGSATFQVALGHDAATNPFVHTYHPDHDNLDAAVPPSPLPAGTESYTVSRALELAFTDDPAALGLPDIGWGSTVLGGTYRETLTGLRADPVNVRGTFVLRRVSAVTVLSE